MAVPIIEEVLAGVISGGVRRDSNTRLFGTSGAAASRLRGIDGEKAQRFLPCLGCCGRLRDGTIDRAPSALRD